MTFSDASQNVTGGSFSKVARLAGRTQNLTEALNKKPAAVFSGDELKAVVTAISRDFSPVFTTKCPLAPARAQFSASELLEISEWISRVYRPRPADTPELMLLPIDPEHVYVYWNLEGAKPGLVTINDSDYQLALRFVSRPSADAETGPSQAPWFDIDITRPIQQQKIALPIPIDADETTYSVVIGRRYPDQRFVAFSDSNPIQFARQSLGRAQSQAMTSVFGLMEPPMLALSPNQRPHASGQR